MGWFADLFSTMRNEMRKKADCSFCARSNSDAGPLVEGPGDVFICSACCEASSEFKGAVTIGRCSFCRKDSSKAGRLIASDGGVLICRDCAELASQILKLEAERRSKAAE